MEDISLTPAVESSLVNNGYRGVPHLTDLQVDPATGFMVSSRVDGISSLLKTNILESFRKSGNLSLACRVNGVAPRVMRWHTVNDPVYSEALNEAREELSDGAEGNIVEHMSRPSNFMDRIAWLRAHRREKWGDRQDVTVNHNVRVVKNLTLKAKDYSEEP